MPENFRPIPGDPGGAEAMKMFDADAEDWILTATGGYQTAAVEAMRDDGSDYQPAVILEWFGRRNHTDENVTVRLMMSPDDAIGLAKLLAHSAVWLKEHVDS